MVGGRFFERKITPPHFIFCKENMNDWFWEVYAQRCIILTYIRMIHLCKGSIFLSKLIFGKAIFKPFHSFSSLFERSNPQVLQCLLYQNSYSPQFGQQVTENFWRFSVTILWKFCILIWGMYTLLIPPHHISFFSLLSFYRFQGQWWYDECNRRYGFCPRE